MGTQRVIVLFSPVCVVAGLIILKTALWWIRIGFKNPQPRAPPANSKATIPLAFRWRAPSGLCLLVEAEVPIVTGNKEKAEWVWEQSIPLIFLSALRNVCNQSRTS